MDELFNDKFRISSSRLSNWDYTNPGIYFVTICIDADICWFGNVRNKIVILSELGKIANQCWIEIPKHHKNVQLNRYVIMPNHLHGIIIITNQDINENSKNIPVLCRDVACNVSTANNTRVKMSKISPIVGTLPETSLQIQIINSNSDEDYVCRECLRFWTKRHKPIRKIIIKSIPKINEVVRKSIPNIVKAPAENPAIPSAPMIPAAIRIPV